MYIWLQMTCGLEIEHGFVWTIALLKQILSSHQKPQITLIRLLKKTYSSKFKLNTCRWLILWLERSSCLKDLEKGFGEQCCSLHVYLNSEPGCMHANQLISGCWDALYSRLLLTSKNSDIETLVCDIGSGEIVFVCVGLRFGCRLFNFLLWTFAHANWHQKTNGWTNEASPAAFLVGLNHRIIVFLQLHV